MALPLILDTDIGLDVDDAVALCFAALEPRIELRAVTTVNGDTQRRASVARALLRLCGREEVPVGAGASISLDGLPHALTSAAIRSPSRRSSRSPSPSLSFHST